MVEYYFANAVTREVLLTDIKVDPQKRIRITNNNSVSHKTLKNSMSMVGQLHSITLLMNYELKAGFDRYSVALELGWKTIRCRVFLTELAKFDELLLEITENHARKNFSSLELFAGIAMAKIEYENKHPEIKHGKARWGNKVASDATLKNKPKDSVLSFVKHYHNFFGLAERTLFKYIRIGEGYLDKKFDDKVVTLFNEGKLSQKHLLDILRKLENKKIIKSRINPIYKVPAATPSIKDKKKKPIQTANSHTVREKTPKEKQDIILSLRKSLVEQFVESGRPKKPAVADNKKEVNPSKKAIKVDNFLKSQIPEPETCFTCPKATPIAVKCRSCGSYAKKVVCDIDVIHNKYKLRNADEIRCERSSLLLSENSRIC